MAAMIGCLFVLTSVVVHMLRNMPYIAINSMHMGIKSTSEYR